MSNSIVKSGYVTKFSKGMLGEKWKKVYVTLYKDSSLFWFKSKGDATSKGNVNLKSVCKYLTCGANVRTIPHSPALPEWASIDHVISFPQQPSKKSQIFFFVCSDQAEFNAWMSAIVGTLPPPPSQAPPLQPASAPPPAYAPTPPTQYSGPPPATQPPTQAPFYPQPPAGQAGAGGIGFEGLGMPQPGQPYPQGPGYPGAYAPPPTNPAYPQNNYAPPQPGGYAPPPTGYAPPQGGYAPPPSGYAPPPGGYAPPTNRPAYPQQQYQVQPGHQVQQPHYQAGYVPPAQPQYAGGGPTTVVYKNKPKKSKGTGKMLAGLAGGAVAGYAASRIFSPFGGFGWGHGSWSSGSWGSFSGGSFGSFGSFGSD